MEPKILTADTVLRMNGKKFEFVYDNNVRIWQCMRCATMFGGMIKECPICKLDEIEAKHRIKRSK